MDIKFWQDAWQNGETKFTQSHPNNILVNHFDLLNIPKNGRVFVPLCGKSPDLLWFAEQGYNVVGVELVEQAVVSFFEEQGIETTVTDHHLTPNLTCYRGSYNECSIEIWVGDIFDLAPSDISHINAIYDRGALVALPDFAPDYLRTRYTKLLVTLTQRADQFLLTFAYDDEVVEQELQRLRPPFILTDAMIADYYDKFYNIKLLVREKSNVVSTAGHSGYRLAYQLTANKTVQ